MERDKEMMQESKIKPTERSFFADMKSSGQGERRIGAQEIDVLGFMSRRRNL